MVVSIPGSALAHTALLSVVSGDSPFEIIRARDRVRHSRILQGGVVDFYVSGLSDPYVFGLYYTKVKLGSPPREFKVQIDTGSDVLWVNCNSCSGCPQSSGLSVELNFYDVSSSSTASLVACSNPICSSEFQSASAGCDSQNNMCSYAFEYGDSSGTSGYYVSDILYFDMVMGNSFIANSSASIIFGSSNYQSGSLTKTDKAIDGIFGFGRQGLSVISQLSSRGVTPKVFSHCLKGNGTGGGILVLDLHVNVDRFLRTKRVVGTWLRETYIPTCYFEPCQVVHGPDEWHSTIDSAICSTLNCYDLKTFRPHYNLVLESIAVNGQLLPIDPKVFATSTHQGTIVDSGTTLTYLVEDTYDPFVTAVTTTVSQFVTPYLSKGNQCFVVSNSMTKVFPLVNLNFMGGASILLRPEDYLMRMGFSDGEANWCIGFQKVQDHGITILGDIVLKDKIFVYDLAHQRIGWANYDCSMSVNVSVTSSKDEFINQGQLSVSSSYRNTLFEIRAIALLLRVLIFIGFVVS